MILPLSYRDGKIKTGTALGIGKLCASPPPGRGKTSKKSQSTQEAFGRHITMAITDKGVQRHADDRQRNRHRQTFDLAVLLCKLQAILYNAVNEEQMIKRFGSAGMRKDKHFKSLTGHSPTVMRQP